ncbi:MAG TPA: hypothetical protein PKC43_08050 [Phycisphaerales bacterium]|nr:hypothetical protein [Phycisphaerales bacterium]HMP37388.1 hypothetical protein [Phycisphaerales bacterium]
MIRLLAGALGCAIASASFAKAVDLTFLDAGIEPWQFMLIDKDFKGIDSKRDFASWVAAAQTALSGGMPPKGFESIHVFGQCFSGGFLDALRSENVVGFSASSASRYWEPAYYDLPNGRSHFGWAWGRAFDAAGPLDTDRDITQTAADAMVIGDRDLAIPMNPFAGLMRQQHLADGPPLVPGGPDLPRYAILFAGVVDEKDRSDIQLMHGQLVFHGWSEDDIMVLFGDEEYLGGKPATRANLEWAWTTWLVDRIAAQNGDFAQVFFFAGDHGNATAPITISVAPGTLGAFGSPIDLDPSPEVSLWIAGNETHQRAWSAPGAPDIDAIAFGNDYTAPLNELPPQLLVYFSVDPASDGLPESEVFIERANDRSASADVFAATDGSNRQMVDGERSLALDELLMPQLDDIDALVLRSLAGLADPVNNTLAVPIFYSMKGSSDIWVYDPVIGRTYRYFEFPVVDWDGDGADDPAPTELDALAMADDGARQLVPDPSDPDRCIRVLYFDPLTDEFLFSVGRNQPAFWATFDPCDVIRMSRMGAVLGPSVYRSCESIGLSGATDNLNALDVIPLDVVGFRPPPSGSGSAFGDPDIDGDGFVNGADVAIVLANWGPCKSACECVADLDGNGIVDGADLALVLAAWTS